MRKACLTVFVVMAAIMAASSVAASGFTYHGVLQDAGKLAEGNYDIELTLYASPSGGRVVAGPLMLYGVAVHGGSFSTDADFGPLANSFTNAYVGVKVRSTGSEEFVTLGMTPAVVDTNSSCPGSWSLDGNAGNPAGSFIGTADSATLILKSNSTQVAQAYTVSGDSVWIGGGALNVGARGGFIGGGGSATIANSKNEVGLFSVVGGGDSNVAGKGASAGYAVIGGGRTNSANTDYATIGGGSANDAGGAYSTVSGGNDNAALGQYSAISGGYANFVTGQYATAGGFQSTAKGKASTAIGNEVNASGDYSFAAGSLTFIDVGDSGTFMWGDNSTTAQLSSSGPNQFIVRANSGVAINQAPLNSNPDIELTIASNSTGSDYSNIWLKQRGATGVGGMLISVGDSAVNQNNAGFYLDNYDGSTQIRRMQLANDGSAFIRSNMSGGNSGVTLPANAGSWSSLSDRNVKTAIVAINPLDVLNRLSQMPVSAWSYITQGENIRHIGPMAQDFSAAFSVGEDDTHISTVDADGVAFAAIQGLNQKLETENGQLRIKLDELSARLSKLEHAKGQ